MWLKSFLCLTGLGTDSLRVKTLNDNPYMSQFDASGVENVP